MNATTQRVGTWILSILFIVWVLMSWAVFPTIFMNALRANETSSLLMSALRILAVSGGLCVMPPLASIEALRAWQKTGTRRLAIFVALFAIFMISFFISNRSFSFAYWL